MCACCLICTTCYAPPVLLALVQCVIDAAALPSSSLSMHCSSVTLSDCLASITPEALSAIQGYLNQSEEVKWSESNLTHNPHLCTSNSTFFSEHYLTLMHVGYKFTSSLSCHYSSISHARAFNSISLPYSSYNISKWCRPVGQLVMSSKE